MASSVSSLNNYSNFPLFNFGDLNLLASGMAAMQGRVDQNKANLQNIGTQLSTQFLDNITRESDKVYFQERLNEALNLVETYANSADLSDNNVASKLSSKLKEVVDDRVVDAISSTTQRRLENQKWDWYEENEPDKYSEENRQIKSRDWYNYVNSEDPYSTYKGGGDFVKYVDLNQRFMEKGFQDFLKNSGINAEYKVRADGSGYFKTIDTYEGTVDSNRLAQAIDAYIGQDGMAQMEINSIKTYGYGDSPESVDYLRSAYNGRNANLVNTMTDRVTGINNLLNGSNNLTQVEKDRYEQMKSELEENISKLQGKDFDTDVSDNGMVNPNKFRNMAFSVYVDDKKQELFNFTYMQPVWKDSKIDEAQAKQIEYEQKERHFNINTALKQTELQISAKKSGYDIDENGNIIQSTNLDDVTPTNVVYGNDTKIDPSETATINVMEDLAKSFEGAINDLRNAQGGHWDEASTQSLIKKFALFSIDLSKGQEIKLDSGRTIIVNDKNIVALEQLRQVAEMENAMMNTLVSGITEHYIHARNRNIDWGKIADTDFRGNLINVWIDDNGEFHKGLISGAKGNNLRFLAKKFKDNGWDKLTRSEKLTFSYYNEFITAQAYDLGKAEKMALRRTKTVYYKGEDMWDDSKLINSRAKFERENGIDFYSSNSGEKLHMLKTKDGKNSFQEISFKTFLTDDGKRAKVAYNATKDTAIGNYKSAVTRTEVRVLPTSSSTDKNQKLQEEQVYKKVASLAGIQPSLGADIITKQVIRNGKLLDEYEIITEQKVTKTGSASSTKRESTGVIVSGEKLREAGLMVTSKTKEPTYNATMNKGTEVYTSDMTYAFQQGDYVKGAQHWTPEMNQKLMNYQTIIQSTEGNKTFDIYDFADKNYNIFQPKLDIISNGNNYEYVAKFKNFEVKLADLGQTISDEEMASIRYQAQDATQLAIAKAIERKTGVKILN